MRINTAKPTRLSTWPHLLSKLSIPNVFLLANRESALPDLQSGQIFPKLEWIYI